MSIVLDGTTGIIVSGNTNTFSGVTVGEGGGEIATNTAMGTGALAANVSGSEITAYGAGAYALGTGSQNEAFGRNAMGSGVVTGSSNSAFGRSALLALTSGTANVAIGSSTLELTTTGSYNVAVGRLALLLTTTGSNNVAVGYEAMRLNTTASNNTAVGYQAGYTNTTGAYNTLIGYQSGYTSNTTNAQGNTCIGASSGYSLTTGYYNTFIGAANGSGYYITTGFKNTIIGSYSGNQGGLDIRTSSNYIVLSDGDGNIAYSSSTSGTPFFSLNGTTADGQLGTTVTKTTLSANLNDGIRVNQLGTSYWNGPAGIVIQFRASGTATGNISQSSSTTAYNTSSDYRLKENVAPMTGALATVSQLKPVTYKWKRDGADGQGFIAHELQEVVPDCVTGTKDAIDKDGNPAYQGVDTSFLVATLTAAIQELKAEFDAYKATHP